jgi:hypothetical protein
LHLESRERQTLRLFVWQSQNGVKRLFLCVETRLKIKVSKAAPF